MFCVGRSAFFFLLLLPIPFQNNTPICPFSRRRTFISHIWLLSIKWPGTLPNGPPEKLHQLHSHQCRVEKINLNPYLPPYTDSRCQIDRRANCERQNNRASRTEEKIFIRLAQTNIEHKAINCNGKYASIRLLQVKNAVPRKTAKRQCVRPTRDSHHHI